MNTKKTETADLENISSKKGIKKKIIILICSIIVLIALMFGAVIILEKISTNLSNEDKKQYDFDFYDADYTEDIFTDKEYLELIEGSVIMFCNMDNVTFGITEDEASRYGGDVGFMIEYLHYINYGDVEGYNNCYSDLYYTVEDPKERFTMQKIYDIELIKISETAAKDDAGKTYNEYVFALSYKILDNNGTLRDDFLVGPKKQYILVTDREGTYKIDGITTAVIKN